MRSLCLSIIGGGVVRGGYIAVEFFFAVTGYLMVQSFFRDEGKIRTDLSIGENTFHFLYAKFKKIYPYVIANCFTGFFIAQWGEGLLLVLNRLRFVIFNILLLNMAGFSDLGYLYVNWYISAMFIALLFLYPLMLFFPKNYVYLICPLMVILIYGRISESFGNLIGATGPGDYWGVVRLGIWRAVAGICAGGISWLIAEHLKRNKYNRLPYRITITLCIFVSAFFIISNMILYPGSQDFISVIFIIILVGLIFSQKDVLYHCYNSRLGLSLRKWSVALFFMAGFGTNIIRIVPCEGKSLKTVVYYVGAVLGAGLTMICINVAAYFQKKWKIFDEKRRKVIK